MDELADLVGESHVQNILIESNILSDVEGGTEKISVSEAIAAQDSKVGNSPSSYSIVDTATQVSSQLTTLNGLSITPSSLEVEDASISQYESLSVETLVTTINVEASFSDLNSASGTLTLSSLQGDTVSKIGDVSITELAVSNLSAVEGFADSVSFKDTPGNLLVFNGSYTQTVLENAESVEVTSGTSSPISLDEMKILSDVVNTFPPEFTLEVDASAKQIVEFATSSNTLENLAVADADVINVISGDPISVEQLAVLEVRRCCVGFWQYRHFR